MSKKIFYLNSWVLFFFSFFQTGIVNAGFIASDLQSLMKNEGVADVFIKMAKEVDLGQAQVQRTLEDQRNWVFSKLNSHADETQAGVRRLLKERGKEYTVFWINNSLFVANASENLIKELAARFDVAYVRGNNQVPLVEPVEMAQASVPQSIEWGVSRIGAPDAWSQGYTGKNVVVANIDTGVRYTHQALRDNYRGASGNHDYNWMDPAGICGKKATSIPCDNNGHGTHTMGTIAGGDGFGPESNDIGVAPEAKWMACKGCEKDKCSDKSLIACAQWIACPTKRDDTSPDCSKAPDVVSNSWGGLGGDRWYFSYVKSWVAAGIFPIFSAGNLGPRCRTTGSPGDYGNVMSVGATARNDQLAYFSSKGPGWFKPLKPDIVAPGKEILSAFNGSDTEYRTASGTSMAAPHVAGAVALMLSKNPGISLIEMYNLLISSSEQGLPAPEKGATSCGGRSYTDYPNPIYGNGLIRIDSAISQ